MAKKQTNEATLVKETETILVFKAIRPLDEVEHQQVSDKLRYEEEKAGVKIVLMPYTCELIDNG